MRSGIWRDFDLRTVAAMPLALALCGLGGCGEPPRLGTITGHVRYRGEVVPVGQVSFLSGNGVPVCGAIDASGSYRVDNVPLGEAIVTVVGKPPRETPKVVSRRVTGKAKDGRPILSSPTEPAQKPNPVPATPAKYADTRTSGLRFTVCEGFNQYDIELK